LGPWKGFQEHEFRYDVPERHGKFGRRVFDPQVLEKPICNPKNVSEIEDKPMEHFWWQQERYQDHLDRHVPFGKQAFRQYLPRAIQPGKWNSFGTGARMLDCVDGNREHSHLAWGQNRHTNKPTDMKFANHGLGVSQVDKLVDLGPIARVVK